MKFIKRVGYFFRTNVSETIALAVGIAGALFSYYFFNQQDKLLVATLILASTLFIMLIIVKKVGKNFYYIFFDNPNVSPYERILAFWDKLMRIYNES